MNTHTTQYITKRLERTDNTINKFHQSLVQKSEIDTTDINSTIVELTNVANSMHGTDGNKLRKKISTFAQSLYEIWRAKNSKELSTKRACRRLTLLSDSVQETMREVPQFMRAVVIEPEDVEIIVVPPTQKRVLKDLSELKVLVNKKSEPKETPKEHTENLEIYSQRVNKITTSYHKILENLPKTPHHRQPLLVRGIPLLITLENQQRQAVAFDTSKLKVLGIKHSQVKPTTLLEDQFIVGFNPRLKPSDVQHGLNDVVVMLQDETGKAHTPILTRGDGCFYGLTQNISWYWILPEIFVKALSPLHVRSIHFPYPNKNSKSAEISHEEKRRTKMRQEREKFEAEVNSETYRYKHDILVFIEIKKEITDLLKNYKQERKELTANNKALKAQPRMTIKERKRLVKNIKRITYLKHKEIATKKTIEAQDNNIKRLEGLILHTTEEIRKEFIAKSKV